MANTVIQLKHSTVQGSVPVSLANGEISINTRDGKIFYADPTGTIQEFSEFSGPAGLNGEIQFNDSGVLGANAGLTYNKSTGYFKASIIESTNNGNGTNFKVGDDTWIGDINVANTLRIKGQQDSSHGYIVFGDANANSLGRQGTGPLTYNGNFSVTGEISSTQSVGDEGGQINLALAATNTTLSGSIAIDIYQNKFRIFETGGTNRGVYIDIATDAAGGVGTNLLNPTASPDTIARNTANAAFITANAAFTTANGAVSTNLTQNNSITASFTAANSAGVYANGAFAAANAATATDTTQNNSITASFTAANSAGVYANGAFAAANAATTTNLTQNNSITAAFAQANAAYTRANNSLNANTGGTVTGTITADSFITTGSYGNIQGANLIYANTFIANTGGYFQFADGSKQYTANSGSSAANSFGRIYTSNNTTFANATVSTDQITFTGIDGVSVTANASTKTITFAGTPGAQGLTVDYGLVTESIVYSLDYGTL